MPIVQQPPTAPQSPAPSNDALVQALIRQALAQSGTSGMGGFLRPADFDKFTPEQLRAVTSTMGIEDERALAERQLGQGEEGLNAPSPQGMQAGGVYQAAHPAQFLAQLADQGAGLFNVHQGRKAIREARAKEQQGAQAMLRALRQPGGETAGREVAGYKDLLRAMQPTPQGRVQIPSFDQTDDASVFAKLFRSREF